MWGGYVASFTFRPFTVIGKLLTASQWHLVIFAEREDLPIIGLQKTSAYLGTSLFLLPVRVRGKEVKGILMTALCL